MNRICSNASKIIELYCELELESDLQPKITKLFPPDYKDSDQVLKIIGDFVFPCTPHKDEKSNSLQSFSFVLVSELMKFGFCRHEKIIQSANSKAKALVFLSFYPWHDVFLKFLNVLVDLRKKVTEKEFDTYLNKILQKKIPDENSLINLTFSDSNGIIQHEFIFKRPLIRHLSSIPENHNLNLFYNYIESKTMIEIFAAVLAERRIVFVSNNLDKLSSCLQASCSLLYPMFWQHILIPILPYKLKDYLLAPIPYLVGCPTIVFNAVRKEEIGEVVVINCDTNIVINPFNDVTETLPQDIVNFLKKNLNNSVDLRGDRIPRIFLMSLVQLIGTYRDAIFYQDTKLKFSNEYFIEGQTPHYKPFIQKIVQLQIFQQFVEERLKLIESNSELTDEFEIEIELYAARVGKKIKNYKEFIRNFKGMANPVVKNAFKSVKQTCKEIKSKIRDKPDKYDFHQNSLSNSNSCSGGKDKIDLCQNVMQTAHETASTSTSSSPGSSSESQMNILQELEGILNCSVSTADTSKEGECNLIDLNDSPTADKRTAVVSSNNIVNPFGGDTTSDLLSDVLTELNKSTKLDRSNWTKFD